jgi:membrane protein implicated in regulation of membrane protease activity
MVYTAKGAASVFAGFGAAALAAYFGGSFFVPFYISSVLCAIAAIFSLFILRPLIRGRIAKETPPARAINELVKAAPPTAESQERVLAGAGRGR